LGAGFGKHAIPFAERGVLPIDASAALIASLRTLAGDTPTKGDLDDLRAFACHLEEPADGLPCMGDAVMHLPTVDDVGSLVGDASSMLAPGGTLTFSFRDRSVPPSGTDRFVSVGGDDDEGTLAGGLEFDAELVRVHDLLQERTSTGWQTRVSIHPKLRLAADRLVAMLAALGFMVRHDTGAGGMAQVVATKSLYSTNSVAGRSTSSRTRWMNAAASAPSTTR
ncbi:MAG TPA: class I SAM-dependent methyltransferase, partial [Caldimonas sp.]